MISPRFLSVEHVIELHSFLLERYGGTPGLRDRGLLESAVAMPAMGFGDQYVHGDLFEMAAAYLFHLVKNHAFVDGNKRIGAMAALAFLELNGYTVTAQERVLEKFVLDVAAGKHGKDATSEFLRQHSSKPTSP